MSIVNNISASKSEAALRAAAQADFPIIFVFLENWLQKKVPKMRILDRDQFMTPNSRSVFHFCMQIVSEYYWVEVDYFSKSAF